MKLVPQTSPLTSRWIPFLEDSTRQSYSYLLPFADDEKVHWTNKSQLDRWFDFLHPSQYTRQENAWTDSYYKGELLLRKTAWVTLGKHCACEYGYSDTWQKQATSKKFQKTIEEITKVVMQTTGCTSLNSCNLNYYPRGGGVGWHADDEFLFDGLRRATCIVSLSLCRGGSGGARKFLVKLKEQNNEEKIQDEYNISDKEQILRHGDLITMEGHFQKHYFHSVWPGDSKEHTEDQYAQGERINLTWRTIVQHLDGSDECRGKMCPLSSKRN